MRVQYGLSRSVTPRALCSMVRLTAASVLVMDRWKNSRLPGHTHSSRTALNATATQYAGNRRATREATNDGMSRPQAVISITKPLITKNSGTPSEPYIVHRPTGSTAAGMFPPQPGLCCDVKCTPTTARAATKRRASSIPRRVAFLVRVCDMGLLEREERSGEPGRHESASRLHTTTTVPILRRLCAIARQLS